MLQGESLNAALAAETPGLPARDRAWVQALAFTTIRFYPRLEAWLQGMLKQPLRARDRILGVALCQGLAELFYFSTPDHAAIAETAQLARELKRAPAVGLINALLRRAQRERAQLLAQTEPIPVQRYACPAWLIDTIQADWPTLGSGMLAAALNPAPMTLRVNLARTTVAAVSARFAAAGISATPHPELATALTLAEPLEVEAIPGFDEGWISVQDAHAQWAAILLAPQPGERILDACAAPGGKTGHLLEAATGELDLTALDVEPHRLAQIGPQLERLGFAAQLRCGDLRQPETWWDGRLFDAILLDAPCSATGVLRRHPDIKILRRAQDIPHLAKQQFELLTQAWTLLRPGGRLLYATCSLLAAENEGVVEPWLQQTASARAVALDLPAAAYSQAHPRAYAQTFPRAFPQAYPRGPGFSLPLGLNEGDGFFYALLQREV